MNYSHLIAHHEQEAFPFSKASFLNISEGLLEGDKRPKFTDWVKAFMEDHPNYPAKKDCYTSSKAKPCVWREFWNLGLQCRLHNWWFDLFGAFLVCWLLNHVFIVSSTIIHSETFLMAMEMAKVKLYSLAIPILPFCTRFGEISHSPSEREEDLWVVVCSNWIYISWTRDKGWERKIIQITINHQVFIVWLITIF